jgi:putative addiction module killer protein
MRKCTLRRDAVNVNEERRLHPNVSRSGRASVQPCRFQVGSQLLRRCRNIQGSARRQSARRHRASSIEVIQRFDVWLTSVSEMRLDYGPGFRVYYARVGRVIYLLLCGWTKATQEADIKRAIEMNACTLRARGRGTGHETNHFS